jgi:outer membrane receptor for ferric coprogen and ferric-rhodotorulic acid
MKSKQTASARLPFPLGAGLFLLPLIALGQATPATPPAADETVVLNPFVVRADSTSGYYASETLSGTQLRSQIRDLANPITVLTPEFMRDIGAVNYQEALEFLPSTREFKGDASDPEAVTNAHRHALHGARLPLHHADQQFLHQPRQGGQLQHRR